MPSRFIVGKGFGRESEDISHSEGSKNGHGTHLKKMIRLRKGLGGGAYIKHLINGFYRFFGEIGPWRGALRLGAHRGHSIKAYKIH